MTDWLSTDEALTRLRVRPQTLYAYVSRGRVRAEPDPAEPRRSRYRASDVAALTERKARGRKAADVARAAIEWGEPVLASAITTVRDGRLYYRGHDAVRLAGSATLEEVARLLRGGLGLPPDEAPDAPAGPDALARAFAVFAARAAIDSPSQGRAPGDLASEAARLLDLMAAAAAGREGALPREEHEGAIHERLGRAWRAPRNGWDAIRRALVLLADHELNASTFAARVIAATLSDIHSAVTGAIGALKGPLHGGANEATMRMLFAIDKASADPVTYVSEMLAAKKKISGFGHRVYKTEDPRATHLRRMSEQLSKDSGVTKWYDWSRKIELFINAEKHLNANVDFYSASTYTTLGIDVDLFTPIFAVSRISGWAAHVIEQLDDNRLIRPRAEYIGPTYPAPYMPIALRG